VRETRQAMMDLYFEFAEQITELKFLLKDSRNCIPINEKQEFAILPYTFCHRTLSPSKEKAISLFICKGIIHDGQALTW